MCVCAYVCGRLKKGKFGVAPYAKGEFVQVVHDVIQIQSTENIVRTAANLFLYLKIGIAKSVELFSSASHILFLIKFKI